MNSHATSIAADRPSQRQRFQQWSRETQLGRRLRHQVAADIEVILDQWFGYHLVVIGDDMGMPVEEASRVRHVTRIIPRDEASGRGDGGGQQSPSKVGPHAERVAVIARDEELPLATESVDVVVMFNALQQNEDPHRLLREVHRVLTQDGHLFVVDANANSLWGWMTRLKRLLRLRRGDPGVAISLNKLEDWLRLLNFHMAPARHKLALPVAHRSSVGDFVARIDNWLADHNIPLGSYYVLFGNKSVLGYLQQQPQRRLRARMMGLPVAKPVIGGARGAPSQRTLELTPDK